MKVIDEMNIKTLFTDVDGNYLVLTPIKYDYDTADRWFELDLIEEGYPSSISMQMHDLKNLRDKLSEVIEQYGKVEAN